MPAPGRSPFTPSDATLRRRERDRRRTQVARRRAAALLALVALVAGASLLIAGGSGGHARHAARRPAPPDTRSQQLAALARRRALAEDRAIDHVLSYTPFVTSGGRGKREVALTFDDGPGPYTPQVLRVLRHFHVHATFFEVGFMERYFSHASASAVRDGHVVGDHTEGHPKMARLRRADQQTQIAAQEQRLHGLGLPPPRLFRPPFGSFNGTTFSLLRARRLLMVLWSVDTQDYRQPGTLTIVRRALHGAKPGAILLMHDAGGARAQTIAALPTIIRRLRRRHYKLVTVPQLMLDDPPPHGQPLPHYLGGS